MGGGSVDSEERKAEGCKAEEGECKPFWVAVEKEKEEKTRASP